MNAVLNFADGVDGAHKSNILGHSISGGLHNWAKTKYGTCSSSPSAMLAEQSTNAPSHEKKSKIHRGSNCKQSHLP